ncbi:MAG TPA: ATP-binding protein [Novosphingobium sp.]
MRQENCENAGLAGDCVHDRRPARFMLTIDNFEHIRVAYGGPVAGWVAGVARNMIARWLGSRAELGQPQGDVIPGRLLRQGPVALSGQPGLSGAHASAGGRGEALFSGLPPLLVAGRDYVVCVVLSVAWVPDYSGGQSATDGAAPIRDPFFGEPPGRGRAWIQRYRADMATAAGVLAAIGKGAAAPLTAADRNAAGIAGPGGVAGARATLPPTGFAIPPVAGHLAYVWQPVRDADDGDAVLFYEMCPQLVGADGVRRDLADVRRALERLGLVAALDRHLADHALDVLASSPDLAIGVQISAQSTSAPAAWAGTFQRITGDRALARRLVVAITETASFPDFGGAIRFVSRLQALGCAVSIDNFGMGYPVVFALFSSIILAKGLGRSHLVPYLVVGAVVFIDVFCAASALITGPEVFQLVTRNLILFTSPVAIANSVVFRPRLAVLFNLGIIACLGYVAAIALLSPATGRTPDLHLVARILGVLGFYLWFSLAHFIAFRLYLRHRRELVEVHHLVAEMERNQKLNEENSRIREDLLRTQRVQMVDSMTSTMAHEVNQPISCASNFIQAARRWLDRPDPDIAEALDSLGGARDEIVRVSERVMAVRRLMQRLSSEFVSIDLDDLVGKVDVIVRRDLAKQDIKLAVKVPDDDDFLIFGCEEELIQVLMNLTANAADALAKGEPPRRIEISLREVDLGEVELVVADNGCGIPAADLARVFDRLYTTKPGGSGLGLPLCRRIVSNHGGTIGLDSEAGKGTRVILRFPRAEGNSRRFQR